ncbi:MAG TPA: C25 family cysteine peptidase, partial [Streptosporangiaceae bacterium]|nr:C25 family cysteine peptidase [Streptosporangiaceae bacterium]
TLGVSGSAPSGTHFDDTIAVNPPGGSDPNLGNNSATVTTAIGTQADLSIGVTGAPASVQPGGTLTYTETVNNLGPNSASNAVFVDVIPANTTLQSFAFPGGWICSVPGVGATGTIRCTDATLATGAPAVFTLAVTVGAATPAGTVISNTGSVSSDTPDPVAANNSSTASSTVVQADLAVTTSGAPTNVLAGSNITYTQMVSNNGPGTATGVTFTQTIPANTTLASFTAPGGWACVAPPVGGTGTITCTLASLAAGGSASFPVAVTVTGGTANGTVISNTVNVTSTSTDLNLANNTATTVSYVELNTDADLAVSNGAAPIPVVAGNNITYTQVVTNNGPAAAANLAFSEALPANTTLGAAFVGPAGWACTAPAVGATGTISCTIATLASGGTATFTVVAQVNPGTPTGTVISDTASVGSTTSDPNPNNNAASASDTVAPAAGNADVAISLAASPSPVRQGNDLTYSVVVTNNGPATATNVVVRDTFPNTVTFISATGAGPCSLAGSALTCNLGDLNSGSSLNLTWVVEAASATILNDMATVSADQPDPVPANNTASVTTLVTAPTAVKLLSFRALRQGSQVVVVWRTGGESRNLGYFVYREANGQRTRLTPALVAGSALRLRDALERHSAQTYTWTDGEAPAGAVYWLEDVDVSGVRTWHGPVSTESGALPAGLRRPLLLSEVGQQSARGALPSQIGYPVLPESSAPGAAAAAASSATPEVAGALSARTPRLPAQVTQFALAAGPAVKIQVTQPGWYRVTQPQLVAAGLPANADPRFLRLFAEGVEQPIRLTGATAGRGGFGAGAALEFYGTGIDTPYDGTREYWLVAGAQAGLRLPAVNAEPGGGAQPASFLYAVEQRQRSVYFAALLTNDGDNFFGALVSATPVEQTLAAHDVDTASTQPMGLEVALQGVVQDAPHQVAVALNGVTLGHISFQGQEKGDQILDVPPGLLREGSNSITLTAEDGDNDISLVDFLRITYPHLYRAESEALTLTAWPGESVTVDGFRTLPARIVDVSDPARPSELLGATAGSPGDYQVSFSVPGGPASRHTLLVVAQAGIAAVPGLVSNQPSHWHAAQPGADMIILTHPAFASQVAPLVQLRRAQGLKVAVVLTDDVYDEFNFGERSPQAVRDLLAAALANWSVKPRYLLLVGDASID